MTDTDRTFADFINEVKAEARRQAEYLRREEKRNKLTGTTPYERGETDSPQNRQNLL